MILGMRRSPYIAHILTRRIIPRFSLRITLRLSTLLHTHYRCLCEAFSALGEEEEKKSTSVFRMLLQFQSVIEVRSVSMDLLPIATDWAAVFRLYGD